MACPLVAAFLLLLACCCCWRSSLGFNNCTARPVSNDLPPATYEMAANYTGLQQVNLTGLDFMAGPQGQGFNMSDADDLDGLSYARRMDFLRERKKHQRIATIRTQILERLGINQTPNTSSPQLTDDSRRRAEEILKRLMQTQIQRQDTDDIYAERVQSFYPSCSLPRNTDRDMWENIGSFHIYYTIPTPRVAPGTSLTVSSAKLRLYKLIDGQVPEPPPTVAHVSHPENESDVTVQCDERFRISVFQYTKPLKKTKKGKKNRKLIDSQMIAVDFAGWVEFDVRSSIRDWIDNTNKNLGFEIVLEDSLANTHNPSEFFQNMNCSEDHLSRLSDNESLGFNNETFPTLDLKTVELLDDPATVSAQNEVTPSTQLRRKREEAPEGGCGGWDEESVNGSCCMVNTYVSMEDIGWDNVIEPRGFITGVCIGGCNSDWNSDNSCEASEKAPLEVLMLMDDSNSVRQMTIPNFITTSCKCRRK